jgi:RNA polymerase sigma-70 factor (ECF subfamily)
MDQGNSDISSILRNCKKNNRLAQKELYRQFYSYSMSICMRYARSEEDAVEIMNDGFLNVFNYIHNFNLEKAFKPWLRKIMINSAIDHFKRNNKDYNVVALESEYEMPQHFEQNDSVSYEDLIGMIRKLPPAYGTVFNLHAIEGYKHEEIADILGISAGTSKSNYSKARSRLQQYLATYFGVRQ